MRRILFLVALLPLLSLPTGLLADGHSLVVPPYTPLWPPPALTPLAASQPDPEGWEGDLDTWLSRCVQESAEFRDWSHTVALQLVLERPRSALRSLERAREAGAWNPEQWAQLDWLGAAAWMAQEAHEPDILEGEACLRRAEEALRYLPASEDWNRRARYARAWLACIQGRAEPAAHLLEQELDLPPHEALRLYEVMLRASSQAGLERWGALFENALARDDTVRVRSAARIGMESYLRWLMDAVGSQIETGLAKDEGGAAIDFTRVEETMARVALEDESAYRGVRFRMDTARSLEPSSGRELLELMQARREFDAIFGDSQLVFGDRLRKAIAWAEGKVERCRRLELWYEVCRWNWGLAFAHGELGHRARAIQASEEALDAARRLGDPYYRSICAHNYFSVLADRGFVSRRLQALPDMVEEAQRHKIQVAVTLSAQGRVVYSLGDRAQAMELLSRAYREARGRGDFLRQIMALEYLCFMQVNSHESERASASSRRGVELLEDLEPAAWPASYRERFDEMRAWFLLYHVWAQPPESTARERALGELVARRAGHFMGNQGILVQLSRAEGALVRGELEHAGSLLRAARLQADSLAYPSEVWRADALEARRRGLQGEPQASTRFYEASLAGLEAAGALLPDREQQAEFLLPARRVYDEYIELLATDLGDPDRSYRIDERSRARALAGNLSEDLTSVSVRSLLEVQATLDSTQLLLQYRVGENRTRLWIVQRDTARCVALPLGRDALREAVHSWRDEIDAGLGSPRAEELGELLLGPARGELARSQHLILIADEPLTAAPFALLRLDGRRVVETHASSWDVSGSVRHALHSRDARNRRGPLVAAAYRGSTRPDYLRLPVLPFVDREVELIAEHAEGATVLYGDQADLASLRSAVRGARFVHLAAHAGLDPFGEPFVLIAPTDGEAGLLHREELAALPLDGVELVTLAACESSRLGSREVDGDLSGLGAAVFAGGARGLIASLWKVEDHSTLEFMRVFYEELLDAGRPPAHALRSAQLRIARAAEALEREWGAFCAYGP